MKIFIDIGHPAHVHYFKNFIWIMQEKGHSVTITARDKEVALNLLDYYKLPYYNRGKGRKGFLGKLLYIFQGDIFLLKKAWKIKPDIFISFGSSYAAHTAWLMRKPHIAFNDTDNNTFQHITYIPFTKVILTPEVYAKNHGKKHLRFDGFMELCALHENHFKPNCEKVMRLLGLKKEDKYVILRFVSWEATHDFGLTGLTMEDKYRLVKELSEYARVIISSESPLPPDLQQYAYSVEPALMHDLLNGANLIVSESLTMSAEAAFLGTPALCISTATAGTLDEEVNLGLLELFRTSEGLIDRALEIMKTPDYKENFKIKTQNILKNKIDVTSFMVWFVENYPESFNTMQKTPDYQCNFKSFQISSGTIN